MFEFDLSSSFNFQTFQVFFCFRRDSSAFYGFLERLVVRPRVEPVFLEIRNRRVILLYKRNAEIPRRSHFHVEFV